MGFWAAPLRTGWDLQSATSAKRALEQLAPLAGGGVSGRRSFSWGTEFLMRTMEQAARERANACGPPQELIFSELATMT